MNKLKSFLIGLRALIDLIIAIGDQIMATQADLDTALTGAETSAASVSADVTRVLADFATAKAAAAPDLAPEVARVTALQATLDGMKAAIDAADAPPAS